MNTQSECNYDAHGGGPYIDCALTLRNISSTENATWTASISEKAYTVTPSSGQLAPGKTEVINFVALPVGCPGSYMITVGGNANTLHIPVICTDVIVNPNGNVSANDICTKTNTDIYTCKVILLANPANTIPANWNAAATSAGGAESIIFSPPSGTLAQGSSIQITVTIVDPKCPVDSVTLTFFVPETPGIPTAFPNNNLTWVC